MCIRRLHPWILTGLAFGCLWASACQSSPKDNKVHAKNVIQNIGSDTMVNLAQSWAEEYASVDPHASVEVSGGGSGTGIAALINRSADIANSSRRMEQAEAARIREATGANPVEMVVGFDALAIFVHKDNPMTEISLAQLAEIYGEKGSVTRWSQMGIKIAGCPGDKLILVSRQSNSGTYFYFRDAILGKTGDFRLGTLDLHGSKDVVELVSRTPCAIGYSGMGYATTGVKMLRVSRRPGESAFAPTVETAQTGAYPISRPLYMYSLSAPSSATANFLKWVQSDAGQLQVLNSGYVPRNREAGLNASTGQRSNIE